MKSIFFPPEWHLQSAVQLVWPSPDSDWKDNYEQVLNCYVKMAKAIIQQQTLLLVLPIGDDVNNYFSSADQQKIRVQYASYNDTWVRDYGGISVVKKGVSHLLNFKFNAWGNKFESSLDNALPKVMYEQELFAKNVVFVEEQNFVLEGGAIDNNGEGLLMTTCSCLLNKNRNGSWTKNDVEQKLKSSLGIKEILWLKNGKLLGDDTDGHVDTLARFVDSKTIMYVQCDNQLDEHYQGLYNMELELLAFCEQHQFQYKLLPVPLPSPVYHPKTKARLPATYANFLFLNQAILVPVYDCAEDEKALEIFKKFFPDREIVSINCLALIEQGGSLHCSTMQYPEGFVR